MLKDLVYVVKEGGMSIGIFFLCCYIVHVMLKYVSATMINLNQSFKTFADRVRVEHDQTKIEIERLLELKRNSAKEHEALMRNQEELFRQHQGITETLGRINGYKHD